MSYLPHGTFAQRVGFLIQQLRDVAQLDALPFPSLAVQRHGEVQGEFTLAILRDDAPHLLDVLRVVGIQVCHQFVGCVPTVLGCVGEVTHYWIRMSCVSILVGECSWLTDLFDKTLLDHVV